MEKFYLEIPSINRKNEIIEYINELVANNSETHGIGSLDLILEGYTFEEALERCLKLENEEFAKKINKNQSKTFLLIRVTDNKIVGIINVRWNLRNEMLQFGGHIGYGIRPTERGKGYNKINLYLGIIEAKKLGLDKVMIGCDVNNIPSDKTLKALGGKLERTGIDPYDGLLTNVYWFDVDETIRRYRYLYGPSIYEKSQQSNINKTT